MHVESHFENFRIPNYILKTKRISKFVSKDFASRRDQPLVGEFSYKDSHSSVG